MNSIPITKESTVPWKDLYRIGGVCGILTSILIVLAIIIYFVWPYQPGISSTEEIFKTIQENIFQGLMSLDFLMVIATFLLIPFFLAIYFATKKANESYALIALVFGLISCVLAFFMRPISELVYLSNLYTEATTDTARNQYLAAGEALSALFTGTSWILYMISFGVELLISSILMLKIKGFGKATAWLGILLNIGMLSVFGVIFPETAAISTMLNLICTLIWTLWNILVARTLFHLSSKAYS